MRSSTPRRIALACVGLALGAGLAVLLRPRPEPVAPSVAEAPAAPAGHAAPTPAPAPAGETAPAASAASSGTEPPAVAAAPAAPPLLDGEAAQEAITDLAVTYDAASVPALARYLAHSDAEVRSAAREGLVQLGERAAIPFLEAAAKSASDAEEARALREAAEFLALPTWSEHRRNNKPKPASP